MDEEKTEPVAVPTPDSSAHSIPLPDDRKEHSSYGKSHLSHAASVEKYLPGLRYEFWNNVTMEEFESESYLFEKEERNLEQDEDRPFYRAAVPSRDPTPRPGYIRRPPDAVIPSLPQISWVLYPEHSNSIFPHVFPDHFVAIITGYITPPYSGVYKFDTTVDDIVLLTLGGSVCYNKATMRAQCQIKLEAGRKISIVAKYYENVHVSSLILGWALEGRFSLVTVPENVFSHLATAEELEQLEQTIDGGEL